ncbi:MAG: precorrin-2 C(20)-methyltransferase [Thermodesulfobacteriota bacterium]
MKASTQPVLYGVGIGPGDPELMTLKAVRVLKGVDVIAVPKSKEEATSLALDIIRGVIDLKDKEVVELIFPMKRNQMELIEAWEESRRQVIERLEGSRDVAFITIGDPLFHSTFIYLLEALCRESPEDRFYNIEVIPGVSSINAASALSCTPLAKSGERMAIIPATYGYEKLKETIEEFDTVVLLKANKAIGGIITVLEESGLKENAVFVSRAGLAGERVTRDLDSLKGKELDYFSIIIIKKGW